MRIPPLLLLAAGAALALPAAAQHHLHGRQATEPAGNQAYRASGTVQSIDAEGLSASVAHADIPALSWPAMTMTFKVKDRALAERLHAGERIEFKFILSGKDYVIVDARH